MSKFLFLLCLFLVWPDVEEVMIPGRLGYIKRNDAPPTWACKNERRAAKQHGHVRINPLSLSEGGNTLVSNCRSEPGYV